MHANCPRRCDRQCQGRRGAMWCVDEGAAAGKTTEKDEKTKKGKQAPKDIASSESGSAAQVDKKSAAKADGRATKKSTDTKKKKKARGSSNSS
mmetsp:Transcript_1562/g.3965  ORF Transcript_1562/g.3965 Transcript_1562/m.3965 type:complete len:93 (-) Transcript_1562:186-464(-)